MPEFQQQWEDFRYGLNITNTDTREPESSWRGSNVTIADDDSMLVPIYAPVQLSLTGTGTSSGVLDNGTTQTTWSNPTYFNGYIVVQGRTSSVNNVYFINTSTGAVTTVAITLGTAVCINPVVVSISGTLTAYVTNGTSNIFKVTTAGSTTISTTTTGVTINLDGLAIWGARLIVWSFTDDRFLFSDASTNGAYDTWTNLSYIGVGYNGDGISHVVPRNVDLVVVKPSGWYSITGTLGYNAALRQMSGTAGILYNDPVAEHNNTVYFTSKLGYSDYAINLMQITGSLIDVAAYYRLGIGDSNVRVVRTNLGYLAVSAVVDNPDGTQHCFAMMQEIAGRWQSLKVNRLTGSTRASNPTFCFAKGQTSRYNNDSDKYLYLCETTSSATSNKFAVNKIKPNTIEPGQNSDYTPSSATVSFPNISAKTPFIIRQIFVEAEMMQVPTIGTMHAYTGNASISAKVYNQSVHDQGFSYSTGSPTGSSSSYTYPFSTFTTNTDAIINQTRVIRFNVDDATWGYTQVIELTFAGLRIRRVWVKGDQQ